MSHHLKRLRIPEVGCLNLHLGLGGVLPNLKFLFSPFFPAVVSFAPSGWDTQVAVASLLLTFGNLCLPRCLGAPELRSQLRVLLLLLVSPFVLRKGKIVSALMSWSILPGHSCSFLLVVVTEDTEEACPCS